MARVARPAMVGALILSRAVGGRASLRRELLAATRAFLGEDG